MTRPDRADILLRKTRQDELVLERLIADSEVDDETLGFHAQQAAEKLLKALLCARSVDYPRTHSLGVLVELLGTAGETLPGVVGDLNRLTPFGTTFRYDEGFSGLSFDRSDWLATIQSLRAFVEARLNA
jgi:HEPN domain-containing protein